MIDYVPPPANFDVAVDKPVVVAATKKSNPDKRLNFCWWNLKDVLIYLTVATYTADWVDSLNNEIL